MESKRDRVAIIGIVVYNKSETASKVNRLLSDFADIIIGRMGIPYRERGVSVISLVVDGTNDEIGALTGKLGNIDGIKTRVAMLI